MGINTNFSHEVLEMASIWDFPVPSVMCPHHAGAASRISTGRGVSVRRRSGHGIGEQE